MIICLNEINFTMEFSLIEKSLFISLFDIIKQFTDNIKLKLNHDVLHIQSVDDANISIIDIKLKKTYFNTYNITKEITYDFSIGEICKILKICSKSRLLEFSFNDTILKITTCTDDDIRKTFEVNSIITKDTFINIENLRSINLENIILSSKNLFNIFTELFIFSDDMCISHEKEKNILEFYTTGDNINTKYSINTKTTIKQDILSKYSLNYLAKYKLMNYFEETIIKIDSNSPIIIHNTNPDITTNFILSPKIIDE